MAYLDPYEGDDLCWPCVDNITGDTSSEYINTNHVVFIPGIDDEEDDDLMI